LNLALCVALLLLALIDAIDLLNYWSAPSEYPIGAEAAGFRYRSAQHLIGISMTTIVLATTALVGPLLWKVRSPALVRGVVLGMLAALTAFLVSTTG
jgi:hypothetical protein